MLFVGSSPYLRRVAERVEVRRLARITLATFFNRGRGLAFLLVPINPPGFIAFAFVAISLIPLLTRISSTADAMVNAQWHAISRLMLISRFGPSVAACAALNLVAPSSASAQMPTA